MQKLMLTLLLPITAWAGQTSCQVQQVMAADTLLCQPPGQPSSLVQLYAVKALNPATPAGQLGKTYLEKRVLGKTVVLRWPGNDSLPNTRVTVMLDGQELNQELLGKGMARVHPDTSAADYYTQQSHAIRAGLGLWDQRYNAETGDLAR
jgi:endonuclease YncB( thermonuclease family)